MAKFNNTTVTTGDTQFTRSAVPNLEFSKFKNVSRHLTSFNAGDIVPIRCVEVLPHDTFDDTIDFVIRQSTSLVPTMGDMYVDIYAFFVPNRVVNQSWKAVQGENLSGSWVAPEVLLAPLGKPSRSYSIGVGTVADYYGLPTQNVLSGNLTSQMHDLKFRGYLECYNEFFRDQNYQPPIAYSKLNVFNGFLEELGSSISFDTYGSTSLNIPMNSVADGSYARGAIVQALYGSGNASKNSSSNLSGRTTVFSANRKPLKANKMHDMFTSVLPSPQKGRDVVFGVLDGFASGYMNTAPSLSGNNFDYPLQVKLDDNYFGIGETAPLYFRTSGKIDDGGFMKNYGNIIVPRNIDALGDPQYQIRETNLVPYVDLSTANAGMTISDFRTSVAVQQYYETLARSGSRYREFIDGFFGLDTQDNFPDTPTLLGHIRRKLDLYQVAQTSASSAESTAQGNLTAFGYTDNGGHLYTRTFLEHGYVHFFAVVRHKNVYSASIARDNFRRMALDFYTPNLANLSEQPVYTREVSWSSNNDDDDVFGYQEAWYEYRHEADRVSSEMRTGIANSLATWNFADDYDSSLAIADGEWLQSNSQEVLDRTLAVTSANAMQFNAVFQFTSVKQRPMPVYSLPGLDIF